MRRKDREMPRDFGLDLIDRSDYGVMSMVDGDRTYSLPLSIARDGDYLYFHSAKEGKKLKLLKDNPNVSLVFVGHQEIPENYSYEELEKMNSDPSKALKFISSVFTTEFESAMVNGLVEEIENQEEKVEAMRLICEKYSPDKMKYFGSAIDAGLSRTNLYRIRIENISAKRKKYDDKGLEMKWGRMD